MPVAVLLVGMLITAISLYLLMRPAAMPGLLHKVFDSRWLYGVALLRLLLGAALIAAAETVAYPRAITTCGWLFVLGALSLVVIPAQVIRRVVARFAQLSPAMTRLWLLPALLFGLFIIAAALA